ncbi:hypothetical protein E9840_00080 [Tissierella creatinini]|nr:hypothetical protein E9840_00080 [Tissierella creatinini]TJX69248.1 hypothetical protein E8P77_01040 [Soehngenia saccharolytica]
MFNNERKIIIIFSSVLFVLSFVFGYFIMDGKFKEQNRLVAEKQNDGTDMEILREENRITPNTFVEERIHYKECGHLVSKVSLADDEYVNMTKDDLNEFLFANKANLQLISFSNVKVVLWGEKNHLCQDHYVIGEEGGSIAIFTIDENGQRLLNKQFPEYPINVLMEVDQAKLIEGIIVDSEEELSDILENYIS